jgi:hypothetical protein
MAILISIGPDEVKVDLADFDLKLQEKLLKIKKKNFFLISSKNVFQFFLKF